MDRLANIGCVGILFVYGVYFTVVGALISLLAFWTQNNLAFWVSHSKGTPTDVPYWLAWVASIPVPFTFIANIVSQIARLFV
jgi:hypothetical protein